jgi:hypothetical protein
MKKEKEITLPVTHDRCPVCGCTDGLVRMAIDRAIEEGKIGKGAFPEGAVIPIMLLDQRRPPVVLTTKSIKVSSLMIYFEVCASKECGAMYCRKFDVMEQDIPVQFQKAPLPNPQQYPPFGRG